MGVTLRKRYRSKSRNRSLARNLYLTRSQRKIYTARKCKRRTNKENCITTTSRLSGAKLCTWEKGGKRRRSLCKRRAVRKKKITNKR